MAASTKVLNRGNPHLLLLTATLLSLSACALGKERSNPWLILPSGLTGRLNECTTQQSLIRTFGASNVAEQDGIEPFSGDMQYVTLFPRDPNRTVEVLWGYNRNVVPQSVTVSGSKSSWRAVHDISLGVSLKELERLNGRPILLSAYDWDHPGRTVESWNNGNPAAELDGGHGGVWVFVSAPDPSGPDAARIGNSSLSSDDPIFQSFKSSIYEITWEFPPWEQKKCFRDEGR
jgi:hypothetical protein